MGKIKTRRTMPRVIREKVKYFDIQTNTESRNYYIATRYEQGKPTAFSLMTVYKGK